MATRIRTTPTSAGGAWDLDENEGVAPLCGPGLGDRIGPNVVHGLKNSLTAVKALAQLGLRNPAESPSHPRLAVIETELARMQQTLNGHLSSTRSLERVKLLRVELGQLVSETLLLLSGRASQAGVRLLARGDATVEADPRRLEEALLNLVANAIEATSPGGEVVVEVRPSAGQVFCGGRGRPSGPGSDAAARR